jgi:hypothetical protein
MEGTTKILASACISLNTGYFILSKHEVRRTKCDNGAAL